MPTADDGVTKIRRFYTRYEGVSPQGGGQALRYIREVAEVRGVVSVMAAANVVGGPLREIGGLVGFVCCDEALWRDRKSLYGPHVRKTLIVGIHHGCMLCRQSFERDFSNAFGGLSYLHGN